ncbi:hypothetical protein ARSEF4850_010122, partial [Beauveria asiatica]
QNSTASPESRQIISGQSIPKREDQSEMDSDNLRERKRPLPLDGICDNRGRQAHHGCDPVHDAGLSSGLAPITMNQGWNVAAPADYRSQTDAQVDGALGFTSSFRDAIDVVCGGDSNEKPSSKAPPKPSRCHSDSPTSCAATFIASGRATSSRSAFAGPEKALQ